LLAQLVSIRVLLVRAHALIVLQVKLVQLDNHRALNALLVPLVSLAQQVAPNVQLVSFPLQLGHHHVLIVLQVCSQVQ
jgi:hypothetical protein